jgi:hypothetical protein
VKIEPKLVSDVIKEMIAKKRETKKSDRHIDTLEGHLTNGFQTFAGTKFIGTLTAADIRITSRITNP